MKKLLIVAVVALLALALVACGSETPTTTNGSSNETTPAVTDTKTTPAETTPKTTPAETTPKTPDTSKTPDTPGTPGDANDNAVCINDISGVDARVYAFEYPRELGGNKLALIYYFKDDKTKHNVTIDKGIADGEMYAVVKIDGTPYTISNHGNASPFFRFDIETPGALIYSGLTYEIVVEIYDMDDNLLYYTKAVNALAGLSCYNAPARVPMNVELPSGLAKVSVDSFTAENFVPWGDGALANLFDGNTQRTKFGGGSNTCNPIVHFSLQGATTLTHYTLVTGGDTSGNTSRNPIGWTLYGKVDGEWVVLSKVVASKTHETGLAPVDKTPFSYEISNPQECIEYKLELTTNKYFQLNELELLTDKADVPVVPTPSDDAICIQDLPDVDAYVHAFEFPSEFGSNTLALVYHFNSKDTQVREQVREQIRSGIADGTMYAVVKIDGTPYTISNYANGNSGSSYFRFDIETPGAVIYSGVTYEIVVEIYSSEGNRLYYTTAERKGSTISCPSAPARTPLNITLPSGLTKVEVNTQSITAEGIATWGDGAVANLFDGDTENTKFGGVTAFGTVLVYFSLNETNTLTHYTFTSGKDSKKYPTRDPLGWKLYGKVDGEWVVLSEMVNSETQDTGFVPADKTPFSYEISNPQECIEYKLEIFVGREVQINELELFID